MENPGQKICLSWAALVVPKTPALMDQGFPISARTPRRSRRQSPGGAASAELGFAENELRGRLGGRGYGLRHQKLEKTVFPYKEPFLFEAVAFQMLRRFLRNPMLRRELAGPCMLCFCPEFRV